MGFVRSRPKTGGRSNANDLLSMAEAASMSEEDIPDDSKRASSSTAQSKMTDRSVQFWN